MKNTKKAYDLHDFPWEHQVKVPPVKQAPTPVVKERKKPGPKPKEKPPEMVEVSAEKPATSADGEPIIKSLVNGLRKYFVNLDIRDPKERVRVPNTPPDSYISNIVLGNNRIGFLEQEIGGDRVYLKFEKGANIPIWHLGDSIEAFADKIQKEIEAHYTKKLAAKVGYRTAIKVAAHRRRLG